MRSIQLLIVGLLLFGSVVHIAVFWGVYRPNDAELSEIEQLRSELTDCQVANEILTYTVRTDNRLTEVLEGID